MTANGAFSFVLHSHMPYARLAGRWPHGEEWVHEAATATYIPLLQTLYDLIDNNIDFALTIGITPILAEQLADETILENLNTYLDDKINAAKRDMYLFAEDNITELEALEAAAKTNGGFVQRTNDTKDGHLHYLAEWYKNFYAEVKTTYNERFNRDIIGAFRQLQDDGYIEIITSAATHGYLPLLSTDSAIKAQIATGVASYEKHFGRKPRGMWLPECAYRPAYDDDHGIRHGIEQFLVDAGIEVFFVETHTVTGGAPVGVAAGDVIGPYGEIKRRYSIPNWQNNIPKRDYSTFRPYFVSNSHLGDDGIDEHSGVAVVARNTSSGAQVWSNDWGYPGDFDYREFHKKAGTSGLQYWRVTGEKIDLEHKDTYKPEWADYKIDQHAEHFAHLAGDLLRDYHQQAGEFGLLASTYDTELFGHWWFEGIRWLGKVIEHLAKSNEITLMTVSDYLEQYPVTQAINLPESSWGAGATHFTWDNGETHWMWQHIHACEERMQALAQQYTSPTDDELTVLKQAAREALLLQSSDWEFLVTTGQARNYAIQRFGEHVDRFTKLADSLDNDKPDVTLAQELYDLDKIFAEIDIADFK